MNKTFLTGNDYISIPSIIDKNANIKNINTLFSNYNGLIEIDSNDGNAILKPFITVNNKEIFLNDIKWFLDVYWIPHWEFTIDNIIIKGSLLAPLSTKSFICGYEIINNSDKDIFLKLGFKGNISSLNRIINNKEKMMLAKEIFSNSDRNKMIINFMKETTILSFAAAGEDNIDYMGWNKNIDYNLTGKKTTVSDSDTINYCFYKDLKVEAGKSSFYKYYFSVGLDSDTAIANSNYLINHDYSLLYNNTIASLKNKIKDVKDIQLNQIMNTNLLFNYFYTQGKTIDTDERIALISRSPLYKNCASYNNRNIFLWAFPGLLLSDANTAKEILDYFFKKQIKNIEFSKSYINGTSMLPGFALDEICAPIIGLEYYLNHTKDFSYLRNDYVLSGLEKIINTIFKYRHKDYYLFKTNLLPSLVKHKNPYILYDNVLVWKVFKIMENVCEHFGYSDQMEKFKEYSGKVKENIYGYLVIKIKDKTYFAWSTDLNGNYRIIYDEAVGSLLLLNYYNFCKDKNEIYMNTINELYSDNNSFYVQSRNFKELANLHTPELTPWVLSAVNSALTVRRNEAREFFQKVTMDNGYACESINSDTGEVATGRHFAACAGILGYTIWNVYK